MSSWLAALCSTSAPNGVTLRPAANLAPQCKSAIGSLLNPRRTAPTMVVVLQCGHLRPPGRTRHVSVANAKKVHSKIGRKVNRILFEMHPLCDVTRCTIITFTRQPVLDPHPQATGTSVFRPNFAQVLIPSLGSNFNITVAIWLPRCGLSPQLGRRCCLLRRERTDSDVCYTGRVGRVWAIATPGQLLR